MVELVGVVVMLMVVHVVAVPVFMVVEPECCGSCSLMLILCTGDDEPWLWLSET